MINAAILGFGTVGHGVAELLRHSADKITCAAKEEINLKYISDIRDFPESEFASIIIHDFEKILADPTIRIVAECIGGTRIAYDYTKRLLEAGKNVVTSNKDLVAAHGAELLALAVSRNVNYLFEASVGGGIPILRPLMQDLCANEYSEIFGILNGTTNYILTKMSENESELETSLAEAQAMGYAEANPESDLSGKDSCNKICILASLAFGKHIYPNFVSMEGIKGISHEDIALTESAGYKIKLIGRAIRASDGIYVYVAPHLIGKTSQLSGVNSVYNGIVVRGNYIGEAMFYGKGAGTYPTASAVTADIIDCAKHLEKRKYLFWEDGDASVLSSGNELESRYYIRCEGICDASAFEKFDMISAHAFITGMISNRKYREIISTFGVQNKICNAFRVLE